MLPPPVIRHFALTLVPVACLPLVPIVFGSTPLAGYLQWGVLAVMAIGVVVGGLFHWRLRRDLARTEGRLCFRCCYDLSGQTTASGTCPECGTQFDWAKDARRWQLLVNYEKC